jgi:BirA family transcriptional regulator, biotin operon repressor / biotin---[acetyl-CoA-carboxylase] ligase
MPPDVRAGATSLIDLAGAPVDRVGLLAELLGRLDREVAELEAGGSPVERFRRVSALDGREIEVQAGDARLAGVAAGIADDGALLLDSDHGRLALSVGEVVSVRDAFAGSLA